MQTKHNVIKRARAMAVILATAVLLLLPARSGWPVGHCSRELLRWARLLLGQAPAWPR